MMGLATSFRFDRLLIRDVQCVLSSFPKLRINTKEFEIENLRPTHSTPVGTKVVLN